MRTGKVTWSADTSSLSISRFAFSPDGRWIATVREGAPIDLREARSGAVVHTFDGHRGEVTALAFAPDGRAFASGGADTTAVVWDLFGLAEGRRPPLAPARAERAWHDLSSRDAAVAFAAIRLLASDPEQAAKHLGSPLRKTRLPVTEKRLARLIADLDSEEFDVREDATLELTRLSADVELALRRARAAKPSLEMAKRLDRLLGALEPTADGLRASRAVAVLEYVNTREALALLKELARDAAYPVLKEEARAAVARLTR